jgi:hypothetical protein
MRIALVMMALAGCVVHEAGYYGPRSGGPPIAGARVDVRVQFFGVPLDGAQDVVFVLDRSGSMEGIVTGGVNGQQLGMSETKSFVLGLGLDVLNGATGNHVPTKLEAAKAELIRTLRAMPDGTRFNVIWFDDEISALEHRMLILAPGTRQRVERFISRIKSGDSTAAVPALELAYRMGARRVVLLSDGLANSGGDGGDLLDHARVQMQRGVRFDTVGLGFDQDAKLMQQLASESGGLAIMR